MSFESTTVDNEGNWKYIDNSDYIEVPCPTCLRRGFLPPPDNYSSSASTMCKTCNGIGWIQVDKYKYLRNGE